MSKQKKLLFCNLIFLGTETSSNHQSSNILLQEKTLLSLACRRTPLKLLRAQIVMSQTFLESVSLALLF